MSKKDSRAALRARKLHIAALKPTEPPAAGQAKRSAGSASVEDNVTAPVLLTDRTELKVGVLIPGFLNGKGGAEKVAGRLADLLARSGMRVDLICRPLRVARPAYPIPEQVRIRTLMGNNDKQVLELKDEGYDLLVGFGMQHFYSRIAHISRLLDLPYIVQECTNPRNMARNLSESHVCRNEEEAFWLRQAVFAHAAAVRLTVPAYAESVVDELRPFTYAFYNALVSPRRDRGEGTPAKKVVCVSGMKNGNKNGMAAVDAFCRFSSRAPGWSLHLYGQNNFRREMAALTERFRGAAVIDHGIVDNVDEIYGNAHALVIPSYEEGLPNVVVEALSYGVPCIGFSDCSGVNQIITHEQTGLLVERDDPEGLPKALTRLSDFDLRRELSVRAKQYADEHFRPETWDANWLNMIHNSANRLNNKGKPQVPAAYNTSDVRSTQWRALLETYLNFSE